ncbi:O-antigen ligase family protein [Consotaella aegiceratis]|uniref:O-antigen ligase family protein n=1 Tax=Consotaella aegiceratis TaxID=3097961 RepID=UPI002F421512
MRIAKARFVDPDCNQLFGTVAVAVSVFVFAYSIRFGQVSILLYYACWLPLILIDYRRSLGHPGRFLWIALFSIFVLLSVFWSSAPSVTARAGVQYFTHVLCALIAARTVGVRTFSYGMLAGVAIVLLYSLAYGSYQYDALDGTYSFVGAFESKNQLGLFASIGLYFAFALAIILRERGLGLLVCCAVAALCAQCLVASQSATSIIACAATIATTFGLSAALLFPPRLRKIVFFSALVIGLGGMVVALNAGLVDLILGAFGKDSTLTGRTYLWSQGLAAWHRAPTFGVGYRAFWVPGFPDAERLWDEFYITAKSGFHFHDTYIEILVELGTVGLILFVLLLLWILGGHLLRLLSDHRNLVSHMMVGLCLMLLVRSFFELDTLPPYTIGAFLLYYAAGLLATSQATWRLVAEDEEPEEAFSPG